MKFPTVKSSRFLIPVLAGILLLAAAFGVGFARILLPALRGLSERSVVLDFARSFRTAGPEWSGATATLRNAVFCNPDGRELMRVPKLRLTLKNGTSPLRFWRRLPDKVVLNGAVLRFDSRSGLVNGVPVTEYASQWLSAVGEVLLRNGGTDAAVMVSGTLFRDGTEMPFELKCRPGRGGSPVVEFRSDALTLSGEAGAHGALTARFAADAERLPEYFRAGYGAFCLTARAVFTVEFTWDGRGFDVIRLTAEPSDGGTLALGRNVAVLPPSDARLELTRAGRSLKLSAGRFGATEFHSLEATVAEDGGLDFQAELDTGTLFTRALEPFQFRAGFRWVSGRLQLADGRVALRGRMAADSERPFRVRYGRRMLESHRGELEFDGEIGSGAERGSFRMKATDWTGESVAADGVVMEGTILIAGGIAAREATFRFTRLTAGPGGTSLRVANGSGTVSLAPGLFSGKLTAGEGTFSGAGRLLAAERPEWRWSFAPERGEMEYSLRAPVLNTSTEADGAPWTLETVALVGARGELSGTAKTVSTAAGGGKLVASGGKFHWTPVESNWIAASALWSDGVRQCRTGELVGTRTDGGDVRLTAAELVFTHGKSLQGAFRRAELERGVLRLQRGSGTWTTRSGAFAWSNLDLTQSLSGKTGLLTAACVGRFGAASDLTLRTELRDGRLRFFGSGVTALRPGRGLLLSGELDWAAKAPRLEVSFRSPVLPLTRPIRGATLTAGLDGLTVSGAAGFDGTAELSGDRFSGTATVRMRDAMLEFGEKRFELAGVNGRLPVVDLASGTLKDEPERLVFTAGNAGKTFCFGKGATLCDADGKILRLEEFSAVFGGGVAEAKQLSVLDAAARKPLRFELTSAELSEFVPGISGAGSGSVAVEAKRTVAQLSAFDAVLRLSELSGFAGRGGAADFVRAALNDFNAGTLQMDWTRESAGTLLALRLSGHPAKKLPFVYQTGRGTFRPATPDEAGFDGEVDLAVEYRIPDGDAPISR